MKSTNGHDQVIKKRGSILEKIAILIAVFFAIFVFKIIFDYTENIIFAIAIGFIAMLIFPYLFMLGLVILFAPFTRHN